MRTPCPAEFVGTFLPAAYRMEVRLRRQLGSPSHQVGPMPSPCGPCSLTEGLNAKRAQCIFMTRTEFVPSVVSVGAESSQNFAIVYGRDPALNTSCEVVLLCP